MSVHYVGVSGHGFLDTLGMAAPGDTIMLPPGRHEAAPVFIYDVAVVGAGDADSIVLSARIEARGRSRLANLTLEAPHYENALQVEQPDARAELVDVTVRADPTGKYPAIVCTSGTIVLHRTSVHAQQSAETVSIQSGGRLEATRSAVAGLEVDGATARLVDAQAFSIVAAHRARIDATGLLQVFPGENQRSIVLSDESVCSIERLESNAEIHEALCDDSALTIGHVTTSQDGTYEVWRTGHAAIHVPEHGAAVVETDDHGDRQTPSEPREVRWAAADGRAFATRVAPRVRRGDTIVLEEGDYFVDHDGILRLGASMRGAGSGTIVHGALRSMEGCSISLSGLTLRASDGLNALRVSDDVTITLDDVILEGESGGEYPAVFVERGTLSMHDSAIAADPAVPGGGIDVVEGSTVEAIDSHLAWAKVWSKSSATIRNCGAYQLWVDDGSVTGGLHITENGADQRGLVATSGSDVRLDLLASEAQDVEVYASASTLQVAEVDVAAETSINVVVDDDAKVDIPSWAPGERVVERSVEHADQPTEVEAPDDALVASGADTDGPASAPSSTPSSAPTDGDDPLVEIERLIGLTSVKDRARTFVRMARFDKLRKQQGRKGTDMTMHSLFLGNPGTGKTTVARLLGKALFQAGAIERDVFVEVQRRDLVEEHIGGSAKRTQEVLERARGGVLFIDEAYALYQDSNNQFGQEAVDTILTFMENHRDEIVIIFAGYSDRMQDFVAMNPGIPSRVPNRFYFEDYTPQEIADIGLAALHADEYTVDETAYRRAVGAHYRQTSDSSNGRWVRNFNQELVAELARRVMESFEDPDAGEADTQHITDGDLRAIAGGDEQGTEAVEQILAELDALVGLAPVKEWVRRLVNRARVDRDRRALDDAVSRPTYHMVFSGNPGTGKTTVANIIARLFHALGLLATPTVKVVERSGLVGQHFGDTEVNTTRAVDEAMGGVLFVDEAYQLYVEDSPRDFGRQAIETLITRLENDRERFVAIFAGYTQSMERFFEANEGLPSRVPLHIEFPDYEPDEVATMVVARLRRSWQFDEEALAAVAAERYAALDAKDRSNGRWARNFADAVEAEQIEHLAQHSISGEAMRTIPPEVIAAL